MDILVAQNISKSFAGRPILHDVSLSVRRGEFVSIVGESGAGKSTLLHLLAGMEKPVRGQIFFDGAEITAMSPRTLQTYRRTHWGYVFQSDNLISTMTLRENIELPEILARRMNADTRKEVDDLLRYFGIETVAKQYPATLSGGEQQRGAIARALVLKPSLMFLDEPTGCLDSVSGRMVTEYLSAISHERGVTVVQVTHNPAFAAMSDRMIRISDGRLTDA